MALDEGNFSKLLRLITKSLKTNTYLYTKRSLLQFNIMAPSSGEFPRIYKFLLPLHLFRYLYFHKYELNRHYFSECFRIDICQSFSDHILIFYTLDTKSFISHIFIFVRYTIDTKIYANVFIIFYVSHISISAWKYMW